MFFAVCWNANQLLGDIPTWKTMKQTEDQYHEQSTICDERYKESMVRSSAWWVGLQNKLWLVIPWIIRISSITFFLFTHNILTKVFSSILQVYTSFKCFPVNSSAFLPFKYFHFLNKLWPMWFPALNLIYHLF